MADKGRTEYCDLTIQNKEKLAGLHARMDAEITNIKHEQEQTNNMIEKILIILNGKDDEPGMKGSMKIVIDAVNALKVDITNKEKKTFAIKMQRNVLLVSVFLAILTIIVNIVMH